MCDFKPELSKKNRYYIPKNRYYELKYFCLQYPSWELLYANLDSGLQSRSLIKVSDTSSYDDPVYKATIKMNELRVRMEMIVESAIESERGLATYIIKSVTEGRSYNWLEANMAIPCGRDMFYDRIRKFYYILDKKRDCIPYEEAI